MKTIACTSLAAFAAALAATPAAAQDAPPADVNHDALVNSQDFFDFLAAFFAGC